MSISELGLHDQCTFIVTLIYYRRCTWTLSRLWQQNHNRSNESSPSLPWCVMPLPHKISRRQFKPDNIDAYSEHLEPTHLASSRSSTSHILTNSTSPSSLHLTQWHQNMYLYTAPTKPTSNHHCHSLNEMPLLSRLHLFTLRQRSALSPFPPTPDWARSYGVLWLV